MAQNEPMEQEQSGTTTDLAADITLTKNVEIYSFEDLTFTIDTYSVRQGDNIASILKDHGLIPSKPDQQREAQLMRLVSELNPAIANLNQISAGQTIFLPSAKGLEPPQESQKLETEVDLENVATYEIGQPKQRPTKVTVKRQVQPEPELAEGEYKIFPQGIEPAANQTGARPVTAKGSAKAQSKVEDPKPDNPKASSGLNSSPSTSLDSTSEPVEIRKTTPKSTPSVLNQGPLETNHAGVTYRTVKVRKGDTLERLLRREGLDKNLIYPHLIKLTVQLNDLKSPNVISTGAELKIPALGNYLADFGRPDSSLASAAKTRNKKKSAKAVATELAKDETKEKTVQPPAPAAGDKYSTPVKRLPSAQLPTADSQNAKLMVSLIFSRLGEKINNKGRLFLPLDEPPHFDIDTAAFPILELQNGRKIILDLSSQLPEDLVKRFSAKHPDYSIFQSPKNEPLEQTLSKLFNQCGYYRVFDKTKPFEGGRDVRLKITSDWLIWPTAESWNRGQPMVINLSPSIDDGTPLVWSKFLGDHGIKVIDLYQGRLAAPKPKALTPVNNFTVIEVERNPSAFAASVIRSFGYSPRLGVKIDTVRNRVVTGGANAEDVPDVFWETEKNRNILEYGDFSTKELRLLRDNGFNVISSPKDIESVLKSILVSENLTVTPNLVLNGSSTGGPGIELTIAGQCFKFNQRSYLFTPVALPDNMTSLDPNQNVVVLHFKPIAASAATGLEGDKPSQVQRPAANNFNDDDLPQTNQSAAPPEVIQPDATLSDVKQNDNSVSVQDLN
jgi:cell envelope opacity-associated protein A